MLVRVSGNGLAIPANVASVRITAENADDPSDGGALTYESAELPLCAPGSTTDCYTLPVSVVLRPGSRSPDATVRVMVTAADALGNTVTRDASLFGFTSGQSQHLDFVLSSRCLLTDCAALGRSCGASGACETVVPASGAETPPDLAMPTGANGPIERVYENSEHAMPDGGALQPQTVALPVGTSVGDLVLVLTTKSIAPVGWTPLTPPGGLMRLFARRVDDDTQSSDYVFTGENGSATYVTALVLVYRNVGQYEIGYTSRAAPFTFPIFDVPAGGAIGLAIGYVIDNGRCTVAAPVPAGVTATPFSMTDSGQFWAWGPLPAGPTQEVTLSCAGGTQLALVWLIPG